MGLGLLPIIFVCKLITTSSYTTAEAPRPGQMEREAQLVGRTTLKCKAMATWSSTMRMATRYGRQDNTCTHAAMAAASETGHAAQMVLTHMTPKFAAQSWVLCAAPAMPAALVALSALLEGA